ncbi:MAG: adenosine kinase [Verrucomicrobiota bacterium]
MQKDFTIIGVGNPIVDSIADIDDSFLQNVDGDKGGMVLTSPGAISALLREIPGAPTQAPGGSAGNTLFALAKMGVASAYLGKIGNCANGDYYRNTFAQLGGDHTRFKVGNVPNGHCLSMVTPDGERTMRTDLGAAMTLAPEEVSAADFAGCHHAHIEGYLLFNEALMMRVLESAKEAGCTVSLDLASFEVVHAAEAILPDILRNYVDLVFANEEEGAAFTSLSEDYEGIVRKLGEYCEIAAVKLGADGSIVYQSGELKRVAPIPVEKVLDTTAAGDLWAAGFLYGWSQQRPIDECAHIGSMLGAAVVQELGSVLPDSVWKKIFAEIS